MKVTLLRHTVDPELTVALAARLCYSPVGIDGLERGNTAAKAVALIGKIIELGHLSVLEHAVFSFGIEDISRVTSHQLVRHRIASYSQQSQRYVPAREDFAYVLPPTVAAQVASRKAFQQEMKRLGKLYRQLVAAGISAEDARFVLPNAAATRIIVTMNARELRHFFAQRCCRRAQWEIRQMAELMLGQTRRVAPALFAGCGPACVSGACPEKAMSCGRRLEVRRAYREWPPEAPRPRLDAASAGETA